jgi:uncharacterized protein (TIGR02300 family)
MAKPELGLKRVCVSCGTKFYDLTRQPAVCPRCGAEQPAEQPRLRRAAAAAGIPDEKLKKRAAAAERDTDEVELEEVDADAVEDADELEDEDEEIDAEIAVEGGERDEET